MEYKVIGNNDLSHIAETILTNRGIQNPHEYMSLTDSVLYNPLLLDNIEDAASCFIKHADNKSNIHIVVDCDVDGYTSFAILYQYIANNYPDIQLSYSVHTGKQHGLSGDIVIPDDIGLLFIPDAGTNDVQQCKSLCEKGIDIIILDHHEREEDNPYAIVVNNHACGYPNKELSGAGIVYKFIQFLDEYEWRDEANTFLDLVALGNISDSMDIREYETRRLINKGLANINNTFFQALLDMQNQSLRGNITCIGIQFYITPLINSLIRMGTYEDKCLLAEAFIGSDKTFDYINPRTKEHKQETIVERVARLCRNAHTRQGKARDKAVEDISAVIQSNHLDDNKIIVCDVTGVVANTMTGVISIKIAEKYNKPCLLLQERKIYNIKNGAKMYGGSGRNPNHSPVNNLKDVLQGLNTFEFVQGHQSAFGVEIKNENISKMINKFNKIYSGESFAHFYLIDFVVQESELSPVLIRDISNLSYLYGNNVSEPYLLIKDVSVNLSDIQIIGAKQNTWKFSVDDTMEIIKFGCSEDDEILNLAGTQNKDITLNLIGTASINSYNGILTPQIVVKDYEIVGENIV